jgi:hypothetical protein
MSDILSLALVIAVLSLSVWLLHRLVPLLLDVRIAPGEIRLVLFTRLRVHGIAFSSIRYTEVATLTTFLDGLSGFGWSIGWCNRLLGTRVILETWHGRVYVFTPADPREFVRMVNEAVSRAGEVSGSPTDTGSGGRAVLVERRITP